MKSADHLDECSSNSDCKTNVDSNSEHRSGSTENLYPSLGIDEIKTLLRYKSMVFSLMIDQKKEINGLFPSLGSQSSWASGDSEFISRKSLHMGMENINLYASSDGKVTKTPMEHDELKSELKTTINCLSSLISEAKPCDGETTEDKSDKSAQNGACKESNAGSKPVSGACQHKMERRANSAGSSGSGGDDGEDRRPRAPVGGCNGDDQPAVEEKEDAGKGKKHSGIGGVADECNAGDDDYEDNEGDHEKKEEEKMDTVIDKHGGCGIDDDDCDDDDDDENVDVDDDDYFDHEKGVEEEDKEHFHGTECGFYVMDDDNDDDDGDDDDDDDDVMEKKTQEDDPPVSSGDTQVAIGPTCGLTCTASEYSGFSHSCMTETRSPATAAIVESSKKSSGKGLKIDVDKARLMTTSSYQSFQSDQDTDANIDVAERLKEAFTCCHNTRMCAWEECGHDYCQAIQQLLAHTQNCHMHVLGGCVQCVKYKDALQLHACMCREPVGKCTVERCDDIRHYLEKNTLPDNRNWEHRHDKLFFKSNPPRTPNLLGDLCLLPFDPSQSCNHIQPASSFGSTSGGSRFASSCTMSELWNQYHVSRPPDPRSDLEPQQVAELSDVAPSLSQDLPVTHGPARDGKASLQPCQIHEQSTATPLSATCVPNIGQALRSNSITQEILWPLDEVHLSVEQDGRYVEHVHWERQVYIGGGSCGRCWQCIDLKTEKLFAIKQIKVENFEMTELKIWGTLTGRHDNILELYGAVKSCGKVTIFMEFMNGGSVEDVGRMHEELVRHIFYKILSAVEFMHSLRFVHRDIKGANILIEGLTADKIRLADFGTSIKLDNGYQQDNTPRGTEPFMAPEVCRSQNHSFSADIWSLMCVLYQMIQGTPPWEEYHSSHRLALLYQIGSAKHPPPSPVCSPEVEDLFSCGFQLEPSNRATAKELMRHRLFSSAPDVSNMQLPRYSTGYDPDYASSLSSLISSAAGSTLSGEEDDVDNSVYNNGSSRGDDSSDEDDEDDDDSAVQIAGISGGTYEESSVSTTEAEWPGLRRPDFDALSAEQQLQSLQEDLFYSLPADELARLIVDEVTETSDITDNDINLLSSQDDFDFHSILEQISIEASEPSRPDRTYSVSDLTKVHIKDENGNLQFSVRERPTTPYGSLGKDLHGNITSVFAIDAFALVRDDDDSPLDVHAEIGVEEQGLRVIRAHDTDNWQPYRWRVDAHGLVEQSIRG
ncbi:uncharacterized protein [Montipora capricornis]|uniref:uncharacterized protein n=1 Tax=Montipora capricornis TaxID=246305 RepID=UPI0035F202D3